MITPSVEWFDIIVTFNYLLLREMEMHIVDFEEKCYYRLLGLLTLLPSGYVMYWTIRFNIKQDRRCTYNVAILRVRLNIVAMESQ